MPPYSVPEYALLGALRERPLHGYAVARAFTADSGLGLVLPLDMSTVYGLLRDLHEAGALEGWRETVGARPPRMVYRLTAPSEAAFLAWLEEPVGRLRDVRSEFLVKLYFAREISAVVLRALLAAQLAASRLYLGRLFGLAAAAPTGSFERLVWEAKVGAARAAVEWIEGEWQRSTA